MVPYCIKLSRMYDAIGGVLDMPNTGERREITGRVNAREAEVVQQSKKLASKTKAGIGRDERGEKARRPEALKKRSSS